MGGYSGITWEGWPWTRYHSWVGGGEGMAPRQWHMEQVMVRRKGRNQEKCDAPGLLVEEGDKSTLHEGGGLHLLVLLWKPQDPGA